MKQLILLALLAMIASGPAATFAANPAPSAPDPRMANPESRTPNPERDYLAYQAPSPNGDSMGWITFRLFSSLVLVGGLMAGGLYIYRRWMTRSPLGGRSELIRVVGRNYLGPKESLCVVKVGKDILLLGVTGSQISFLHRWEEGNGIELQSGESGFHRQMESTKSQIKFSGIESSIRSHIRSLQEHVAQLRSSVGRAPRA